MNRIIIYLLNKIGVLIKHENIVAAMTGQKERVFPMVDVENHIYIAYLPLAHILELCCGTFLIFSFNKIFYFQMKNLNRNSYFLSWYKMWLFISTNVN